MGMFSFDHPVKMKASDQFGFSTTGTLNNTGDVKTAGLKTFLQKKVDEQLNKMTCVSEASGRVERRVCYGCGWILGPPC